MKILLIKTPIFGLFHSFICLPSNANLIKLQQQQQQLDEGGGKEGSSFCLHEKYPNGLQLQLDSVHEKRYFTQETYFIV